MLDLRVDKRWNFERWQLNIFMDIQNAYGSKVQLLPYLTTVRDANWDPWWIRKIPPVMSCSRSTVIPVGDSTPSEWWWICRRK